VLLHHEVLELGVATHHEATVLGHVKLWSFHRPGIRQKGLSAAARRLFLAVPVAMVLVRFFTTEDDHMVHRAMVVVGLQRLKLDDMGGVFWSFVSYAVVDVVCRMRNTAWDRNSRPLQTFFASGAYRHGCRRCSESQQPLHLCIQFVGENSWPQ